MTFRKTAAAVLFAAAAAQAAPRDYFAIRVVDDATGRGVPLTYLKSVYKQIYVTDSNGYVAYHEPGLMDGKTDVWFDVKSYGYEEPAGAFGIHGVGLKPQAGKTAEIRLKRKQIAERLYRMTGYGIYRDTALLGKTPPVKELLNAQVTGSDTVQCAVYRGKTVWMWQDTDRVGFELGNFSMTGATTDAPDKLDPDRGLDFDYIVNKPGDFAKPMAVVPREGSLPIWADGLTVVKDDTGRERLIAKYIAANKDFSPAEAGLLLYNDDKNVMERLVKFTGPRKGADTPSPGGHAKYVVDQGVKYVYYDGNVRVKADYASVIDPQQYEAFTCLKSDGTADRRDGKLVWSWVKGAKPVNAKSVERLVNDKLIQADESPFQFRDVDSGKTISPASGGVAWNEHLKAWVYVFGQQGGDSMLGEIWYSVANSPQGPWTACKKVATHAMRNNNNDLYNVVQHYELARENGRYVYFSGTFVNTFSGNPWQTPFYNYNNIVYRLDLNDPRLKLPAPPPGLSQLKPDAARS